MSAPHDNHSDGKYPEDKVSHYPKAKKKLEKMAKKAGYKNAKHMDKTRSKPNYMPGPGSPKY